MALENDTHTQRGGPAMWAFVQINSLHLSHDLPCQRCGHPAHIYLACGDECDCKPTLMPGAVARADRVMPQEDAA